MKRLCHLFLSALLSVTILFIGTGVDIVRCQHSGKVTTMTSLSRSMGDMGCDTGSGCMSVLHVELSPTSVAPPVVYDFHAVQPLLALLPTLVPLWQQQLFEKVPVARPVVTPPWRRLPRAYLARLSVLLI